jgi:hypothetical protein
MKFVLASFAIVLSMAFAVPAIAAPQQPHAEHAYQSPPVAVPAQHWTPDAPLREGMRRARAAVENLQQYETGQMGATDAVQQAAEVEAAVVFMFANCKLAAEPDEALHGILVPLITAAQALKADPQNLATIAEMRAQIAHYPQYFDDPGWAQPNPDTVPMHD